jgi:tripartite-type tricarboxylate transporter receptor subunit TctC
MSFWYGLLAPAGTPDAIVKKIYTDVMTVLQTSEVRGKLEGVGIDLSNMSTQQFKDYMRAEAPKWAKVVKDSGAKLD